jgi:hypothetical protein
MDENIWGENSESERVSENLDAPFCEDCSSGKSVSSASSSSGRSLSACSCYCDEDGVFNHDCADGAPNIPEDFTCCKNECLNRQFADREELHQIIGK